MTNVEKTAEFVKNKFVNESTGHDWWHMYRVWQLAKSIAKHEKNVDIEVVELTALLHDIADHKFHGGDMEVGPREARKWLESLSIDEEKVQHIEEIIRNISFKASKNRARNNLETIEGQIVHDADKLDALGAIGIARVFALSGAMGRPIYNPDPPSEDQLDSASKKWGISSIHHFDDKLLLLKNRMFTKTGKAIAQGRHQYMEDYLKEFYSEWDGKA